MPKASKQKVQELVKETKHPEVVKPISKILSEHDLIQYSNQHFANRAVIQTKFNTGLIKFTRFYFLNKTWAKYLIAASFGLVMSIATVLLVQVTGLYTGGFGACLQGVARMVYVALCKNNVNQETSTLIFNALFWGMYLILNIPLTLFAYFKINKQFAMLSTTYLLVLQIMGFVWGITPGVHSIQIFGDTTTVDGNLASFNVRSIIFAPNWFPTWDQTDPNNWTLNWAFNTLNTNPGEDIKNIVIDSNLTRAFLLLVYSVVFAIVSSMCYALMFILGGSTAGSDYLTIYWSQEKNKNVGSIFIIITTICMLIGVLLGSYGAGIIAGDYIGRYAGWQYIFSANLFTSLLWVFLNGLLINKLFPWHKLIRVEIYSPNINPIKTHLRECGYTHPTTIIDATGGYSNAPTNMLLTICMCVELPKLITYVRQVDADCLISSSIIADIDGKMALQKQTC